MKMDRATITSVSIRNFRSIASTDVNLSRLTVFVGRNGTGKSNFLQAIRFLADAVGSESLEVALERAYGLNSIVPTTSRIKGQKCPDVSVGVDICFDSGVSAAYRLIVGSNDQSTPIVRNEYAKVTANDGRVHHFTVAEGTLGERSAELKFLEHIASDRLALPVAMTVNPEFKRLTAALGGFDVYDYRLDKLSASQAVPPGERGGLNDDSSNLAVCLWHLKQTDPHRFDRINTYLARMLDGVTVDVQLINSGVVMSFPTMVSDDGKGSFPVAPFLVSDGTLRMTAALTALFQSSTRNGVGSLMGLEEPEAAVHPAVLPIFLDAMVEASAFRQILVSTHSPDLIDHAELSAENIRIVERRNGNTLITPVDDISKETVQERLYTLGELLRLNQLSGATPS